MELQCALVPKLLNGGEAPKNVSAANSNFRRGNVIVASL